MAALARKMLWLTVVIGVLVGSTACEVLSRSQPTASAVQVSFTPTPRPCASIEFTLPQNILETGKELRMRDSFYRTLELAPQQYGWLSVHLDLIQDVVRYGEAIPLRLTITNEIDQPVIFVQPQDAEFLLYSVYPSSYPPFHPSFVPPTPHPLTDWEPVSPYPFGPIQIYVYLDPFPDEFRPPKGYEGRRSPLLFSILRPGQSCTVEWELMWNETVPPLPRPIPPGDYTLKVFLRGTALGPQVPGRRIITVLDIGGWVGTSEASNPVTLTILPPD